MTTRPKPRITAAWRSALALQLLATLCVFSVPGDAVAQSGVTLIRSTTVIDGTGAPPRENVDVLIIDGRIAALGAGLKAPGDAETIDGTGKFVIPGLIDAHVHLNAAMVFQLTPEEKQVVVDHVPKAFLFNGVTTILNAGSPLDWIIEKREAQKSGQLIAPRIIATGDSFKPEGGWGSRHGGGLVTAADARKMASEHAAAGVDGFKIIIDDGLGSRGTHVEIPDDMLQAIVEVAQANDLPLYVHAINLHEYHRAADIGARAILHGMEDPIPAGDSLMEKLLSKNVVVVPTLSLFEAFLRPDPRAGAQLSDPILEGSVPAFLLEDMRRGDFIEEERRQFTAATRMDAHGWARDVISVFRENVTAMHKAGVRIAVGTDAGGPVGYNFQGYNTPWEVKLLVECGLTPMEALVAATRNGAEAIGIADEVGTLVPGKRADLLILAGNPIEDIENIRQIEWVVQDGKVHERQAFASRE